MDYLADMSKVLVSISSKGNKNDDNKNIFLRSWFYKYLSCGILSVF